MRRTQPLPVAEEDRALLLSWLASAGLTKEMRLRARIVLASAGGQGARMIARGLGVSIETVYLWRRRYQQGRIEGLRSRTLAGRRSEIGARRASAILRAGRARARPGAAPTVAAVARAAGVSRATVRRLWERHGLRAGASIHDAAPARDRRFEVGSIVGIVVDLPSRVLVRVAAPSGADALRDRGAREVSAARSGSNGRGDASASAGDAILTALEAFGGEDRLRARVTGAGAGGASEMVIRLTKGMAGASLEILEAPSAPGRRARRDSTAEGRARAGRLIRTRTLGEWLARARAWLEVAPRGQEPALRVALGHLMDYFAVWSEASEPFIWMAAPPARARAPLPAGLRAGPAG